MIENNVFIIQIAYGTWNVANYSIMFEYSVFGVVSLRNKSDDRGRCDEFIVHGR